MIPISRGTGRPWAWRSWAGTSCWSARWSWAPPRWGDVLRTVGLGACPPSVTVPGFVYLYALVGATGFVFTKLVRDFDRSAGDLVRYNLRLPAALPLAAGVYLLSDRLVGSGPEPLLAALAFATGLLVNTAYERIRDLAVSLLSPRRDDGDAGAEGGDNEGEDGERNGDDGEETTGDGSEDGSGNEDEGG